MSRCTHCFLVIISNEMIHEPSRVRALRMSMSMRSAWLVPGMGVALSLLVRALTVGAVRMGFDVLQRAFGLLLRGHVGPVATGVVHHVPGNAGIEDAHEDHRRTHEVSHEALLE